MQIISSYFKEMGERPVPVTSSSRSISATTTALDCDLFFYKIVDLYLRSKNLSTQKIPTILTRHEKPCHFCAELAQRFVVAIGVQSSRDPVIHDDHFRLFGNVFDPNFPSNKLRLYFCGMFGIDPKSLKPANGKKLTGSQVFLFLTVICNISERIMTVEPSTVGGNRSNSEKEDVIISCIHTATQFKHSLLIPDWLAQHGGWNALCDVADKIAQDEGTSSQGTLFGATIGLSAGALVVGGLGLLGMAISKR